MNFFHLIFILSFAVAACICCFHIFFRSVRAYLFVCREIVAYLISLTYCVRRALIWHFKMISHSHTYKRWVNTGVPTHDVTEFSHFESFYFMCCEKFYMFELHFPFSFSRSLSILFSLSLLFFFFFFSVIHFKRYEQI